jgi:F-box and WD-40 domain protein 1/11
MDEGTDDEGVEAVAIEVDLPPSALAVMGDFETMTDMQQLQLVKNLMVRLKHKDLMEITFAINPILCRDFIGFLPSEIAEKILSYLEPAALCIVERVCGSWQRIVRAKDKLLWRRLLERNLIENQKWDVIYQRSFGADAQPGVKYQVPEAAWANWKSRYMHVDGLARNVSYNWHQGLYQESRIDDASIKSTPEAPQHPNVGGQGIYCIQFDDDKIVSGGRDHRVKSWNLQTHELEKEFVGHTGSVLCLQFDESKVISGSSDTAIRVWDLETGECTGVLNDHEQSVLHLNFNETRLVSCSKDRTIIVWRWLTDGTKSFDKEHVLRGHEAAVNVVEFDERYVHPILDLPTKCSWILSDQIAHAVAACWVGLLCGWGGLAEPSASTVHPSLRWPTTSYPPPPPAMAPANTPGTSFQPRAIVRSEFGTPTRVNLSPN